MKRIESKEDIKLFRRLIKNEIKKEIAKEKKDIAAEIFRKHAIKVFESDEDYNFELLNDDNEHICHLHHIMFDEFKFGYFNDDVLNHESIIIDGFMHNSKFDLNKNTGDYRIRMIADKIINKYNAKVDRLAKFMIEEPDYFD